MKKLLLIVLIIMTLTSCTNKNKVSNENSSVVYEIFVGSFYDSNNDGIGDLKGITTKLDYLQDLGVGKIWLTPIHQSDSYHKYDVLDYYSIDESFGTMEDFEELIAEANKRNIGIIIDLVLNHTSVNHPWFIEAKKNILNNSCDTTNKCDYYNFTDEKESNTVKLSDKVYYETVFGSHMPDLNLDNEDVKAEIKDIVYFWLDKGIDGFRLDAPFHYYGTASKNNEFLSWLNKVVKDYKSDAYIVGEVWSDEKTIISHYESGIDSFFNFPASYADGKIVSSIRSKDGNALAKWLVENNEKIHTENSDAINSMFLSNHDQGRSAAFFTNNLSQWKLMINTLLLSPGTVYIYYGEEIGMLGSGKDQNKRLAMPWGSETGTCDNPAEADYTGEFDSSVSLQMKDKSSIYNYYKKVITIRNKYSLWEKGNISYIDFNDKGIYGVKHSDESDSIIVIHNYSDEEKTIKIDEKIKQIINIENKSSIKDGNLKIPGMSSVIVEIER